MVLVSRHWASQRFSGVSDIVSWLCAKSLATLIYFWPLDKRGRGRATRSRRCKAGRRSSLFGGLGRVLGAALAAAAQPLAHLLDVDVDDRGDEEGQGLREQEAADDRDAERPAELRSGANAERDRQGAEGRGPGGPPDRPQAA